MTMKRTDLEKNLGLKIRGQMRAAGTPDRFGQGAAKGKDGKAAAVPGLMAKLLKKNSADEPPQGA